MWRIPKPVQSSESAFDSCISRLDDADLKQRLESVRANVAAQGALYDAQAVATRLHTIAAHDSVDNVVTKTEMRKVYRTGMLRKGGPGRPIYDSLMMAPANGRCPLCMAGLAKTLDHHLPQGSFPAFAVNPANLVPVCSLCNLAKHEHFGAHADDEALHPYFDDLGNSVWLEATVGATSPATISFDVIRPHGWTDTLFRRLEAQFDRLELRINYCSSAASELTEIRDQMRRIHDTGGAASVRDELSERADSIAAVFVNHWRLAFFRALAASDWYCDGGFAA